MTKKCMFALVLVVSLYFMYASTFTTDYLMNDEWQIIGTDVDVFEQIAWHGLSLGRPLYGVYRWAVYAFAEDSPTKIQIVRFIHWAGIAGIAMALYLFLHSQNHKPVFSFFVVLWYFALLPWQGLTGYSLQTIGITLPVIGLSLAAFFCHFYVLKDQRRAKWMVTALCLLLAMQSAQHNAFFAVIPLSYLALTDWERHKANVSSFLVICGLVFVMSTITYKIGVDYLQSLDRSVYERGATGIASLLDQPVTIIGNTLNPFFYWSVFKWWSFPFPFHAIPHIPATTCQLMASAFMLVWIAALLGTCMREVSREGLAKWLALLVCLGFGAIFIIADSPYESIDHRPHIVTVMTGVVVVSFAYAIQVLAHHYPMFTWPVTKIAAAGFVIFLAFGAQSNVYRGIVHNRADMLDFMRAELSAQPPQQYEKIIVVSPHGTRGCVVEPCGPWFGYTVQGEWHMTRPAAYNYAMVTAGINPHGKAIVFTHTLPAATDGSIVIDWDKYIRSRKEAQQ